MFEKLTAEYFAADELSNAFLNEIQTCRERAEAVLPADTARILGETHCFHDWYLTACALDYKNHCVLTLTKGNAAYRVQISGIAALSVIGELISDKAAYPESDRNPSFAQVMDLWLDYQNRFECCLLLDNERYIQISANGIRITRTCV